MTKGIRVVVFLAGIQGCTFLPEVQDKNPEYERCNLVTKKMDLVMLGKLFNGCEGGGEGAAAYCLASALYSSTTAVVSGSFVLVGNTIHWLEKQGKCEERIVNIALKARDQDFTENEATILEVEY
jgi:hypothetical protein